MENIKTQLEEFSENVTGYVDSLYQLSLVKVTEKAANTAAYTVTGFIITIFAILVLLLAGIGAAWWLGELLESTAAGFFVVAGFYLLCMLFIFIFRKKIIVPLIRNGIVKKMYE